MQIIQGHDSPDTAYIVEDYPYGFTLRCKIRYWIEFDAKKGARFCSQTSNPKKAGEHWNKPKKSTYCYVAGAMFVEGSTDHVKFEGLSEYGDLTEAIKFNELYGAGVLEANKQRLADWINRKTIYERKIAEGIHYITAAHETALEVMKAGGDSFMKLK